MLELLNGNDSKKNQDVSDVYTMQQDGTQVVGCYCCLIPPDLKKKKSK